MLSVADIQAILASAPGVLVVGAGNPGLMKPDADFVRTVEEKGITVVVLPTKQAVEQFNTLTVQGKKCAGCFHLTC